MHQDTRPDADDDLFGRAEQAFRLGAFEEALEGFEGLVERYPESGRVPEALRNIGEIYRILRSPQTALVFLREIPQRYPAPSQLNPALLSVSEVALETGDRGQAFTALEQIRLSLGGVTEKQFLLQRVAVKEAELADQGRSARLLNSLRRDYTRLMELATDSEEASEYRQRIEALESKENGD
jgi:tetratricopeptide (TPR) repeat protein